MTSCEWCGRSLGRFQRADARFCSTRCRVAAHRASRPPRILAERPRWVCWRPEGDRKRPVTPWGAPASVTDPDTWSSLGECEAVSDRVGFVVGDGIGCIDLDHCLPLTPLAERVLAANPGTWAEVSPSGAGLHVWGLLQEAPGRKVPGIEVYSRQRFITVTGKRWRGAPRRLKRLEVPHVSQG